MVMENNYDILSDPTLHINKASTSNFQGESIIGFQSFNRLTTKIGGNKSNRENLSKNESLSPNDTNNSKDLGKSSSLQTLDYCRLRTVVASKHTEKLLPIIGEK